jgi:3-O-methylgallate 3,4-dioxygenase
MAEVVLGIGTSHSPVLSTPPELMPAYAERDKGNKQLLKPPRATLLSYDELLAQADTATIAQGSAPDFAGQHARYQMALAALEETVARLNPDVLVIVGDDQEELYFDDNMPAISIYWGATVPWIPRASTGAASPSAWGYGETEMDYPVDSELALHLIRTLMDADFDVGQSRYLNDESGGRVGPIDYISTAWTTPRRRQGLVHAYGFVLRRILNGRVIPIVPVTQNTCYPPNQISSRRSYALGRALRQAIEAWESDKRVAVIGSGGLSHFVVDEEIDRLALRLMQERNAEGIASLPRARLQSAASEINNWIAAAGALEHLQMEVVDYIPARRTPAGTGGGWGFARWT